MDQNQKSVTNTPQRKLNLSRISYFDLQLVLVLVVGAVAIILVSVYVGFQMFKDNTASTPSTTQSQNTAATYTPPIQSDSQLSGDQNLLNSNNPDNLSQLLAGNDSDSSAF